MMPLLQLVSWAVVALSLQAQGSNSSAITSAITLEPPRRVGFRTPEPSDRYNNGSNRGIFWFPHTITTMPDSGVLVLRVAVHPDADIPNNHAAMYTSANRGLSFTSQTNPRCSAANASACSLARTLGSNDARFGPTLSWELSIPQHTGCVGPDIVSGQLLGIPYQTHENSSVTCTNCLGWNASVLAVEASGGVTVMEPHVSVPIVGLPHTVLNDSTLSGGIKLSNAHAYSGEGVTLSDGSLLALLTDVTYVSEACKPTTAYPCRFILAIRSTTCGRSWHYLSTVTDGGTEASVLRLDDGRLLVVFRHNFQGAPYHSVRFKQTFSVDQGRSWGGATEMRAATGSVPPHSVMPTLKALHGSGGYLLSGGRNGMYLWYCQTTACVDAGNWVSTNIAAHHNAHAKDPFGKFPPGCLNESGWQNIGTLGCPSKSYLGLTVLTQAPTTNDTARFVVCYSHCSNVSSYGFCFTELGRGQEVFCVRGGLGSHIVDRASSGEELQSPTALAPAHLELPRELELPNVPADPAVLAWLRSATVVQIQGCELNLLVQNVSAAAAWRALGFDTVVFDPPSMHNVYFPEQAAVSEADFQQVLGRFKAAGFKVLFYSSLTNLGHSPLWQNGTLGREHPEWSMRDEVGNTINIYGNPWLSPCSAAAVNASIAYTEQLVDKYQADGVLLDNNIYELGSNGTAVDYCQACEDKFRLYVVERFVNQSRIFFGIDATDIHIPRNKRETVLYQLWISWRNRVWAEEIIAFRQHFSRRGLAVAANILYLSPAWTYGSGLAPKFQDLVISESRSMTPGYLADKAAFSFTAASSADHPLFDYVGLIVERGRVATCADQKLLPPEKLVSDLISSWMHGTRPWCFSGGLIPVTSPRGNHSLNPFTEANAHSLATFEHLLRWFVTVKATSLPPAVQPLASTVAYLSSFASRDVSGQPQVPSSSSIMHQLGVPLAVFSDLFLTTAQLAKCRVLLIEEAVCCMSAGLRDMIVDWASTDSRHTLVVSPNSAARDEIGRPQSPNQTLLGRVMHMQQVGLFRGRLLQGEVQDAAVQKALLPYSWLARAEGSQARWDLAPYADSLTRVISPARKCQQATVHLHFSNLSTSHSVMHMESNQTCPTALPFPYGSDTLGHFCCSVKPKVPAPGHAPGCPSGVVCCASAGIKRGCQGAHSCAKEPPQRRADGLHLAVPVEAGCYIEHVQLHSPLASESSDNVHDVLFNGCSGHVNVSRPPSYGVLEISFVDIGSKCQPAPMPPAAAHNATFWRTKRQLLISGMFGSRKLPTRSVPDHITELGGVTVVQWNLSTLFPITSSVFYVPADKSKRSETAFLMHHGHTNCICPMGPRTACIADNPPLSPPAAQTTSVLMPNGSSCFARCAPGCRSSIGLGGTSGGGSWFDLYNTSSFLNSLGYDVFLLSMPLKGINVLDGVPSNHDWFRQWEEKGDYPLRYFVEPCILTVNYAMQQLGYLHVHMMGLSGGGWTTTAAAAIDPRIERSFPIAGTMPCALPWTPSAGGDYEQDCRGFHEAHGRPVYDDCNYLCWYVLGSLEAHRMQLQILHEYDDCCFSTHDRHPVFLAYENQIREELRNASHSPGVFAVSADAQAHHEVCTMDKILVTAGMAAESPGELRHLPCDVLHGSGAVSCPVESRLDL